MGTAQIIMPESKNNISGYPRKGQTNAKLLIIDGSSMLSTSYYGNLPKDTFLQKLRREGETL